ncbi:MAG: 6-phosphofructokinase [SAR324 cluster bacterium]|nr:6-phosphofructokinase [SAR324 cluster bacterium]
MKKGNAVYAQSGGVTSVINASAFGVITEAMQSEWIETIYGGFQGINGILDESLVNLGEEDLEMIQLLRYSPGAALGSCRKKLPDMHKNRTEYERIIQVCEAHNIRYFFYNGGNDSMDTAWKISQFAEEMGYDMICVGVPKTVDNDLPVTDNSPGFGSAAKYNAVSILEGAYDVASMYRDSTKVFVLETMGRHAGWIAASTTLARKNPDDPPHIVLLPETMFNLDKFLVKVETAIARHGYAVIAVSEGLRNEDGSFVAETGTTDSFGHAQLGGVVHAIQSMLKRFLKLKTHGAMLDYCQRSGRHLSSRVDVEQAIACGQHAVRLAEQGQNGQMVTIVRESNAPYRWTVGQTSASNIANHEKIMPAEYISEDGMDVTQAFYQYARPLISGEDYPAYLHGIPQYSRLSLNLVDRKLPPFVKS